VQSSRPPSSVSSDLFRFAGLGTQFAATLGVFGALGWWLDTKLGSSPWLLIVGIFAGFGLGLYSMTKKLGPSAKRGTRDSEPPAPNA
jgi:F0F1-type ATP synthase assembly protein I